MKGVIYARYSAGPRQTDQSIEGQVADCKAFAEQHGIDIVGLYADRHVSGTSTEGRDEFLRMVRDAEKHKFDAVIVWKIDRFGRSREDIALYKGRLRRAGVQLMYARESVPEGPEGIILESVLEGLAEYYSADLRQKIQRGLRESAKKGKFVGQLPIGYTRDADGRVVIDPEKAEAVREVYRRHIAGAQTEELISLLRQRDILGTRGKPVTHSVVYRMLRNEKYLGRFEIQGVEIPVDPIIDEATFAAAAGNFKTSRNNAAGKAKMRYLLSGKCLCGRCGRVMTGSSGTGKLGVKYDYYRCKTPGCETQPVRRDALEDAVIEHTLQDVLTDDMIELLTARILAVQDERREHDPAGALRKRVADLERRRRNLLDAIEAGGGAAVVERVNEVSEEIGKLEAEICRMDLSRPQLTKEMIRSWLLSFREGDITSPAFRLRIANAFIDFVDYGPELVTVYYNVSEHFPEKGSYTRPQMGISCRYTNTPAYIDGHIISCFPRN